MLQMPSPAYSSRPTRWFRPALWQLAVFVFTLCMQGAYAQSDEIDPKMTFDYKVGWVNKESSTFGVSILAIKKPDFVDGSPWSIMVRYGEDVRANITSITNGWGHAYFDPSSSVFVPNSEPFTTMYYVVYSSGQMTDDESVRKLTTPVSILYFHTTDFSKATFSVPLNANEHYSVNDGVILDQIPNASYGPWKNLRQISSEKAAMPGLQESSAAPSQSQSVDEDADRAATTSLEERPPASSSTSLPDSAESPTASKVPSSLETVLPPVKFIKGDPNYDPNVDVIGTMLAAPKTGLYLTSIILGIGIVAHAIGTYQRFQYQREYRLSLQRSKNAHFRA